jgi:hypothetical protein
MKTIVFTLKEGQENNTTHGWKRIELIPGMVMPHRIDIEGPKPATKVEHWYWCFVDGELDNISDRLIYESSWGRADEDLPYRITYEKARWL